MDQLPVSLISTDLKYTLSSLKIKTLQKARQYYINQQLAIQQGVLQVDGSVGMVDKLEKIKKYLARYDNVKDEVWRKINCYCQQQVGLEGQRLGQGQQQQQLQQLQHQQSIIQQALINNNNNYNNNTNINNNNITNQQSISNNNTSRTQSINHNQQQLINNPTQQQQQQYKNNNLPLSLQLTSTNTSTLKQLILKCLSQPAITQLTGLKGCGKSTLALYFGQIFSTIQNKTLYFVNCSAGITYNKYNRLQQQCPRLQYRDSYQLQHVLKVCDSALKDQHVGCLIIDGLTNLLMQEQKTLVILLKLFKIFTNLLIHKQCKIIITNYVQQLFQHVNENQQLTNHYTYYSSVTSEFIKYKFYLKKEKHNHVKVRLIRGGKGSGEFVINENGIKEV